MGKISNNRKRVVWILANLKRKKNRSNSIAMSNKIKKTPFTTHYNINYPLVLRKISSTLFTSNIPSHSMATITSYMIALSDQFSKMVSIFPTTIIRAMDIACRSLLQNEGDLKNLCIACMMIALKVEIDEEENFDFLCHFFEQNILKSSEKWKENEAKVEKYIAFTSSIIKIEKKVLKNVNWDVIKPGLYDILEFWIDQYDLQRLPNIDLLCYSIYTNKVFLGYSMDIIARTILCYSGIQNVSKISNDFTTVMRLWLLEKPIRSLLFLFTKNINKI